MTSTANHRYPRIEGEAEEEAAASLAAEFEDENEFEDESEYEDEAFLGGIAKALGGLLGESEGEEEAEYDFEFETEAEAEFEEELEDEAFVNPIRRIYPDAELMAHLSSQAARAEGEEEAEAFIGALIPLAARLIPRAAALIHAQRAHADPRRDTARRAAAQATARPPTGYYLACGAAAHGAEPVRPGRRRPGDHPRHGTGHARRHRTRSAE